MTQTAQRYRLVETINGERLKPLITVAIEATVGARLDFWNECGFFLLHAHQTATWTGYNAATGQQVEVTFEAIAD